MAQLFLTVGLAGILVIGGCGNSDPTNNSNSKNDQKTENTTPQDYSKSYELIDETHGTKVTVVVDGNTRTITSNGLPNHTTGQFPNRQNPNTISEQKYSFTLPLNPQLTGKETYYNIGQAFGIAYNGVLIEPFAAEWYQNDRNSGWQLAALKNPLGFDQNNAHVQPGGKYHYHGLPTALLSRSPFIGWAADGFPIYGHMGYKDPNNINSGLVELKSPYSIKKGTRPNGPGGTYDGTYMEDYEFIKGSGDLDACNGRSGVTPEYPQGTYYYVATQAYPWLPLCFKGTIANSFKKTPGSGMPPRGRRPPPMGNR